MYDAVFICASCHDWAKRNRYSLADCIYVMDKGRVVQAGTYEELINQDGLFAALARRQLA